jgi:hypothetical protein
MAIEPTNIIVRVAENDTNLPGTGLPNKTAPSSTILGTGYDDEQVVTAENLNYIFDNFGEWLTYLKLSQEEQDTNISTLNSDVNNLQNDITNLENIDIIAGEGIAGGGDLTADRTLTLGTPSTLDGSTSNSVTTDSHTHNLDMASQAESQTGTDNTKLVTPLRVHEAVPYTFSPSSVNGGTNSVTLPNGLIMKWGDVVATADATSVAGQSVTFTKPFPNQCLNVQVSVYSTVRDDWEAWGSERTASGFQYRTWNILVNGTYLAIGY